MNENNNEAKTCGTCTTTKGMRVAGRIISGLIALALIGSAGGKFFEGLRPPDIAEQMAKIGWEPKLLIPLGIVELTCVILYLIPNTAVLGAVLLTGYMGGAIATHVRIGDPFIAKSVIGVLVWLGLYLRDGRIRAAAAVAKCVMLAAHHFSGTAQAVSHTSTCCDN